jgi:transposase
MSKSKRKNYDDEFKRQTVEFANNSERADSVIEKDMGLYQGAIRHWRADLEEHKTDAFPGTGHLRPVDQELRELRHELEITRQERDILKKAVAIFSHPPRTGTNL